LLSKKKFGAGAFLNDAGIKGIAYGPGSVKVFDPKKTKTPKTTKLPKSLQTPKKPIGLTNKKESARQLISRRIDPDFYAKEELMSAVGSVLKKKKPHEFSTSTVEVEMLPPWVYQGKATRGGLTQKGFKDFDEIQEVFYEADPTWAAQLDEAHNTPGGDANELVSKWLSDDDLIPAQAEEVAEWNMVVERQEEIIETLESGGYTPKGMTDEEVDIALKKIFEDQEIVEIDVDLQQEFNLPEFNSGGPVTKPLYADRRYI
jgi:hypothetical protein